MAFKITVLLITLLCAAPGSYSSAAENRLTVEESVQIALKSSARLHSAAEVVREAEFRKKEAFGGFLPKISTSYSYTRMNPAPYFNFPGFPPLVPPGTITSGTNDNYNWALELRQPLFAGGAILVGYELGRINEDVARINEAVERAEIIKEVKVAYFQILKAENILKVAKQTVEGLSGHRDQAKIFYDLGLIPKNDLLFAEVELANANQFLLRAGNGVDLAKSQFNTFLHRDINSPMEVEDVLAYRPFEKSWDDCLKTALENRSEIRGTALQLEQARKYIKQIDSEYLPNISLAGNYSRYGDEPNVSGSAYKGQESWYATISANWNIWEGNRTKSRLGAGLSKEKQAIDAAVIIRDRIILDLKGAYLRLKEAEMQILTIKEAVALAEENSRIAKERFKEQVARAIDVIDAQTILTRVRSDYYNALGDYHINLAGLERAMGIGLPQAK